MPKGDQLTPNDVAIVHDLVAWALDQDHDDVSGDFLAFLVQPYKPFEDVTMDDLADVRVSLDRITKACEEWF